MLEGLGDISRCHSRDQLLGWRQCIQGKGSTLVVAHLAFGEQQHDGPDLAVAYGMQLGVQATFGASDTAGNSPFLSRLAAVRCALR